MSKRATASSSSRSSARGGTEPHPGYFAIKRAIDVVAGGVALVLALPVMVVVVTAIKLDSAGPVLYKHSRVGERGRIFDCYKFRSMYHGAAARREELRHLSQVGGPAFKLPRDPRITRVGRILRRTSIDELPQLIHVLRGELSLVGPRPLSLEDFQGRHDHISDVAILRLVESRTEVKPGLTCLWQVSGRSNLSFNSWMRLDEEYMRRRSIPYDLFILVRTVWAVISMHGAM